MAEQRKILYIDRDGTIIVEPHFPPESDQIDGQVDDFEKFALIAGAIPNLIKLQQAGFELVMITNQDGLGTANYAQGDYDKIQRLLLQILASQGIHFSEVRVCPHFEADHCECRKPKLGLVEKDLVAGVIDKHHSYVIGDRDSDRILAERLDIGFCQISDAHSWAQITREILTRPRTATTHRNTQETQIEVSVNLDEPGQIDIHTGLGFFDHMLEQIAKHGGFSCQIKVAGDLHIDDHHTVEDTALALGSALRQALSDKLGIARYGFLLPMDESLCQVAIDLSGRPYFVFEGNFPREHVGELSTELVPHFFRSLSETLQANINLKIDGDNTHHMVESCFKAVGRALRMAISRQGHELPSTKGKL